MFSMWGCFLFFFHFVCSLLCPCFTVGMFHHIFVSKFCHIYFHHSMFHHVCVVTSCPNFTTSVFYLVCLTLSVFHHVISLHVSLHLWSILYVSVCYRGPLGHFPCISSTVVFYVPPLLQFTLPKFHSVLLCVFSHTFHMFHHFCDRFCSFRTVHVPACLCLDSLPLHLCSIACFTFTLFLQVHCQYLCATLSMFHHVRFAECPFPITASLA